MSRVIEVTVTPQGETKIQTKGFFGGSCLQASQWLEQTLGITTTDSKTAEYYQSQTIDLRVEQK